MTLKYKKVAVGGTFDYLHLGHKVLLSVAFNSGESVAIGVTSDDFARKLGKIIDHDFSFRVRELKRFLGSNFSKRYEIYPLEDYFGPASREANIDAIVVSKGTVSRAEIANELRKDRGMEPLKIIVIDKVLADDGLPISSTRIKSGEIDEEGHRTRTY